VYRFTEQQSEFEEQRNSQSSVCLRRLGVGAAQKEWAGTNFKGGI
jgi:hypothetical protein